MSRLFPTHRPKGAHRNVKETWNHGNNFYQATLAMLPDSCVNFLSWGAAAESRPLRYFVFVVYWYISVFAYYLATINNSSPQHLVSNVLPKGTFYILKSQ